MKRMIIILSFLLTSVLILNGCMATTITDTVTEKKIKQMDTVDPTLSTIKVQTDGMLADVGYVAGNHPFGIGNIVLVDLKFYERNGVSRGDIVVFKTKNNKDQSTDIARVVGLPGESVNVKKGQVYIDGNKLDTFYGDDGSSKNNDSMAEPLTLLENEYFLLADVRWRGFNDSQTTVTAFSEKEILGKVVGYNKKLNYDLDFIKNRARIGMSELEVRAMLGEDYYSQHVDNSDVWMYEDRKNDGKPKYLNEVAFEEIKKGTLRYQLFIIWKKDKAFMYSYFYKGEDGEVWNFSINPDGTTQQNSASSPVK